MKKILTLFIVFVALPVLVHRQGGITDPWRNAQASDFVNGAECVESDDGPDRQARSCP